MPFNAPVAPLPPERLLLLTCRVPALTKTLPVNVLTVVPAAPPMINVAAPDFVRAVAVVLLAMTEAIVSVFAAV